MPLPVRVSPYRWVVLSALMLISIAIQVQWLSHAPIARAADVFYAGQFDPGSLINIDFLAMSYMLVYLVVCIPASYVIDTFGVRIGVTIGAVLAGGAALLKGIYATSFTAVLICQLVLSVAQPFVINAVTALAVRWFPLKERGLAVGLASLAQYLGIIIAMIVTPLLVVSTPSSPDYGQGIDRMLMIYGIATFLMAVFTIIVMRERPSTPPSRQPIERHGFTEGLRHIIRQRDMVITLVLFFIGLGIFNAVSSMTDAITASLGVKDSNGLIGGLMLIGGVIGAVILPILSDAFRKRKLFLVICIAGMVPGVAGLAFAGRIAASPDAAYGIALASSFILGFFVMSAGPIGFQYAAEVSVPAPESTSQGLLLLAGQITGLVFVAGMTMKANLYLSGFMTAFVALSAVAFVCVLFLRESPMIITENDRVKAEKG
jgi:sugar phosphate permease